MNQNWRYIFPKKLEHFKALIVNNKSKLQQQNENKLMCINTYIYFSVTRSMTITTSFCLNVFHFVLSL